MITNEERTSDLAAFGGGGLNDDEMEQRVSRFRDGLRRLREDPAEAARVAAIAADADDTGATMTLPGATTVHVTGSGITLNLAKESDTTLAALQEQMYERARKEDWQKANDRLEQERMRLAALLQDAEDRPRPRGIWRLVPSFAAVLVAILAGASLVALPHATTLAATIATITLAATAAVTALTAQFMTWTSVRELNRFAPDRALALLHGTSLNPAPGKHTTPQHRERIEPAHRGADITDQDAVQDRLS